MVLSWVSPYSRNELTTIIYNVTEPVLRPFRISITLGNMRLDLGPILALFALSLLRKVLWFIF
jgi:YggT family protein